MVKQRMSSADVAGEVACLRQRVLGLRLANVYDLNAKTYVLKLSKSGEEGDKVFLLLESGTRFHTIQAMPDKSDTPSNFTLKLRKHLRTRRVEEVRQLGVDRVVDFVFGTGPATYHLIMEMYSQGNVILADGDYQVLTLLRSHRDDDKGLAFMARHPYPMHAIRLRAPIPLTDLQAALAAAASDGNATLKTVVGGLLPYGPAIAEHVVASSGLAAGRKLAEGPLGEGEVAQLFGGLQALEAWFAGLEDHAPEGIILLAGHKQTKGAPAISSNGADAKPPPVLYNDYNPLRLAQHSGAEAMTFTTFDDALAEFYSKIADQRTDVARADAERQALSRLDKMRADQGKRVSTLEDEAAESMQRAALIEYNLEAVDAAIDAVNAAIATGMDWQELDRMIKDERKAGNPVAALIASLQLDQNRITLLLSNNLDEDDEEALTRPATRVPVDLSLSAYSNARLHHDSRKKQETKAAKTLAAHEEALKAAEKKAAAQLTALRNAAPTVRLARKPAWYERFHWFISSENYLVISGRDAQQNEYIVKRYFRKGDIYVHAELHGASSTIIKNHEPTQPVPPITLQQAGCACVCRSRAWEQKVVTSAWWVHHHQVSKTAPTGEYLTVGSFMIRGKKNFLPPVPLVFGFGFMFRVEDSCIAKHLGERAVRGLGDDESIMGGPRGDDDDVSVDEGSDQDTGAVGTSEDGSTAANGLSRQTTGASSSGTGGMTALDRFMDSSADVLASSNAASFGRYGLSYEGHEPAAADTSGAEGVQRAGSSGGGDGQDGGSRRHISVKERALMKKGAPVPQQGQQQGQQQKQGQPQKQQQQQQQHKDGNGKPSSGKPGAATGRPPLPDGAPLPASQRGKKTRQQKAKERYADQDEEDKALALQVLGSAGAKKGRNERRAERKAKKEAKRKVTVLEGPGQEVLQEAIQRATAKQFEDLSVAGNGADGQDSGSEVEDVSTSSSDDEGAAGAGQVRQRQQQQQPPQGGQDDGHAPAAPTASAAAAGPAGAAAPADTNGGSGDAGTSGAGSDGGEDGGNAAAAAAAEADREEISALLAEENIVELPDEDRERLRDLDALTGIPRSDDVLLYAVAVCGPYSCMTNYKFKVKLTPGTQKKGKATKQALELLTRAPDTSTVERDLMRAVPEMDMINAMVGTVKLSMPGLQKLKQGDKKSKKAMAKAKAGKQ